MLRVLENFIRGMTRLVDRTTAAQLAEALEQYEAANSNADPKSGARQKRRSAEVIDELQTQIRMYVRNHPGERSEEIRTGLGLSPGAITLPLRKLVADGVLEMVGDRRWAQYYLRKRKQTAGRAR